MNKNLILTKLYATNNTAVIQQKLECKENISDFRAQRHGFFQKWAVLIDK